MQNSTFSSSKSAGDPAWAEPRNIHSPPLLSSLVTGIPQHGLDPLHSLCLHPLLNVFNVAVERREEIQPGYQPQTAEQSSIHSPLECSTVQKHQMWETVQQEAWSLKDILSPESGYVLAQQWRQHMLKASVSKKEQMYRKFSFLHLPSFQSILQCLCRDHVPRCHLYFRVYLHFWISPLFAVRGTALNLYTM